MYSKMIHDSSLPPTIQVMSLKFLSNLPEVIRQKAPERVRSKFSQGKGFRFLKKKFSF